MSGRGAKVKSEPKVEVESEAKAGEEGEARAESGLAASRETKVKSEPRVKSESNDESEPRWPSLGVGSVAMKPGVKRERKEAVQRLREVLRLRGVANVNSQGEAKLAAATEGAKQWYCRACGKNISCSNKSKHIKRIHPRSSMVKRGRPKGNGKRGRRRGGRTVRYACEGIDIS